MDSLRHIFPFFIPIVAIVMRIGFAMLRTASDRAGAGLSDFLQDQPGGSCRG